MFACDSTYRQWWDSDLQLGSAGRRSARREPTVQGGKTSESAIRAQKWNQCPYLAAMEFQMVEEVLNSACHFFGACHFHGNSLFSRDMSIAPGHLAIFPVMGFSSSY